jgi:hypothetical protein
MATKTRRLHIQVTAKDIAAAKREGLSNAQMLERVTRGARTLRIIKGGKRT